MFDMGSETRLVTALGVQSTHCRTVCRDAILLTVRAAARCAVAIDFQLARSLPGLILAWQLETARSAVSGPVDPLGGSPAVGSVSFVHLALVGDACRSQEFLELRD